MDGNTAYTVRLKKVDQLLRDKDAPSYAYIADKIGCCEHTAEKFMQDLRTRLAPWGIDIVYSKLANSWVYSGPGRCVCAFIWISPKKETMFNKHFTLDNNNPPEK